MEAVYQEALHLELLNRKIPLKAQESLKIRHNGSVLSKFYIADFVCFNKIIVEIKALTELSSDHDAQVLNYLKVTGFKLGLLINFGQRSLEVKRIVL
ncbi:GxxExxY protein [Echinicola soli]|uniref:GxxExxY protein n=1 Tax=Echinicola soli TaxID=2591634 RepID=UPI001AEF4D4F